MSHTFISPGRGISIDGYPHDIQYKINDNEWQICETLTGRAKQYTQKELLRLYKNGHLTFAATTSTIGTISNKPQATISVSVLLQDLDEGTRKKVQEKYDLTRHIIEIKKITSYKEKEVTKCVNEYYERKKLSIRKPHFQTIFTWMKKYKLMKGSITAFIPKNYLKGNRSLRNPEIKNIVDNAIQEIYLTNKKKTKSKVIEHAQHIINEINKTLCQSEQLPKVTRKYVDSRIAIIPISDIETAREGFLHTRNKYRTAYRKRNISRVLQIVQIDHTLMDVILVDDDGNKLGRAYLTICIDVFTRSVLGYHISLKGTSTESVLDCIKHAVLPKSNHSDSYPNVETSWEQFGLFETIIVDNGKEFHSRGFKDFCLHYNIIIERCAVKAGHQKGIVEKFFDRLNKAIFHHLEGTTFSNTQMRKNYNSQKKAKLTLTDLHELITTWIINIYHNHPHSGLAYKTPNEVWNENIKLPQIRLVNNINDLEKLIGNHYERQINPTGILLEYLTYNSRALQEIRKSSHLEEKKYKVILNRNDLSKVQVYLSLTEIIEVPCINQDYAKNLTLGAHRIYKKRLNEQKKTINNENLLRKKFEFNKLIKQKNQKKKKRRRTSKKSIITQKVFERNKHVFQQEENTETSDFNFVDLDGDI